MRRKHCEKKEKLLVTSNFSFHHGVFKRLVLQTHENQGLFGRGLTLFYFINEQEKSFTVFPLFMLFFFQNNKIRYVVHAITGNWRGAHV